MGGVQVGSVPHVRQESVGSPQYIFMARVMGCNEILLYSEHGTRWMVLEAWDEMDVGRMNYEEKANE